MQTIYMEALCFAENLTAIMEQRDLTKYRLAKMSPCSPSTVTNWLNGTIPRGAIRARLIEVLGVSEDELFGDNKKPASIEADGSKINPRYFELSDADRAAVDALIEHLAKAHQ